MRDWLEDGLPNAPPGIDELNRATEYEELAEVDTRLNLPLDPHQSRAIKSPEYNDQDYIQWGIESIISPIAVNNIAAYQIEA